MNDKKIDECFFTRSIREHIEKLDEGAFEKVEA